MEVASCPHYGAQMFQVAPRFFENLFTPEIGATKYVRHNIII
jgi:hypothetical protein